MTDVAVDSKGKCVWSGPATFKVNCKMEIREWPFDNQTCELAFGSYTYGENLLKIKLFKDKKRGDFASKELIIILYRSNRETWDPKPSGLLNVPFLFLLFYDFKSAKLNFSTPFYRFLSLTSCKVAKVCFAVSLSLSLCLDRCFH